MARLKPEFDTRNTKIIGLSVDPVENHKSDDDAKKTCPHGWRAPRSYTRIVPRPGR